MRWLKRIIFTFLAVILLLVIGGGIIFYIGMKPYRQLAGSWVFKENQNGPVIGDLGGMPVAIPQHFARFVEYQDDPHFLEPRQGPAPVRTAQSKLRSFGFEVRFPDMAPLTDATREEKRKSNIYNTMWLDVGVDIASYYDELSLNRLVDAIPSPSKIWVVGDMGPGLPARTWKEPHGYLRSANLLYGLVVNEVQGYDDAKRYKYPGVDMGDQNIYYHINEHGNTDTYAECNNVKHDAARCEQYFILPTVKNTMIKVSYRIGLLPQWREIQASVGKVMLGFAVYPKNNDNKITNKPLTPSRD
jgi:hypothetical protein